MSRMSRPAGLLPRLPSLLSYPLRGSMPWMLGALCLLRLMHHLPNVLGMLFYVMFLVMAFKLAVEALTNTAHGRDEPLGANDLAATDGEAFRQIVLMVLVVVALVAAVHFLKLAGLVIGLLAIVLLMPAAVILLSMNDSILNALNPVAQLSLIGRLGTGYFAAVIVAGVLMVVSWIAEYLVASMLPTVGELPATFISLYSLVAVYHVLGDLIHRHHEQLGLDIAPAVQRATYANPAEDEAMRAAEVAVAEGRRDDAIALLGDMFRGRGASDPVHERWREYVIAAGDIPRLVKHDREYIASLLATGKDKRALAVHIDTAMRDPEFRIEHDESVARLVRQAMGTGQVRLGVQLAAGFEERFPDSPHTPDVVLAVAWAMADQFDQAKAAMLRVQKAMRVQADHPLNEKLHAVLLQIDKLPAITPR